MPFLARKKTAVHEAGFTLIEVLVAVTLFSVVVSATIASFIGVVDSYRKTTSQRVVMDNLALSVESMIRGIKTGMTYHCGSLGAVTAVANCSSGASFLAFEPPEGRASVATDQVIYCLGGTSGCPVTSGVIWKSTDGGGTFLAVTAPEIAISTLKFYVRGTNPTDQVQPSVVIIIRGTAGVSAKTRTTFSMQTTVAQRALDTL